MNCPKCKVEMIHGGWTQRYVSTADTPVTSCVQWRCPTCWEKKQPFRSVVITEPVVTVRANK